MPVLFPLKDSGSDDEGGTIERRVLETLGAHPIIMGSIQRCTIEQIPWWIDIDERITSDNFDDLPEELEETLRIDDITVPEQPPLFGNASLTRDIYSFLQTTAAANNVDGDSNPPFVFYAGSDKLNPVPFFVLNKLAPGFVGGFMSALVHT